MALIEVVHPVKGRLMVNKRDLEKYLAMDCKVVADEPLPLLDKKPIVGSGSNKED